MKTHSKSGKRLRRKAIAHSDHQVMFSSSDYFDHTQTETGQLAEKVLHNQAVIQQKSMSQSDDISHHKMIDSPPENKEHSGKAMPEDIRSFMESRMRYNFRNVRIHDNTRSAYFSRKLNAEAFTHGHDIFFNKDKFRPETTEGKHLLAHELTHVVQQAKNLSVQNSSIQRQTNKPEWKKSEEKFKAVVVSLDPKTPKSNTEKFKTAMDKTLATLGKKKVRDSIFKKLRLNPRGRQLFSVLGMSGYTLYSLSKKKVPALELDIKVKDNTWLTVKTGGDFKKPEAMVGIKVRF